MRPLSPKIIAFGKGLRLVGSPITVKSTEISFNLLSKHHFVPSLPLVSSSATALRIKFPDNLSPNFLNIFNAITIAANPPFISVAPLPNIFFLLIVAERGGIFHSSTEPGGTTSICPLYNKFFPLKSSFNVAIKLARLSPKGKSSLSILTPFKYC